MAIIKLESDTTGEVYEFFSPTQQPSDKELGSFRARIREIEGTPSPSQAAPALDVDLPDMGQDAVSIPPPEEDDSNFFGRTYGALKSTLAGTAGGLLNLPAAIATPLASDSYAPALGLRPGETEEDVIAGDFSPGFDTYIPRGGGRFEITEYGDVIDELTGRRVVSPFVSGQAKLRDVQIEAEEEDQPTDIDSALDSLAGGNPLPMLSFAAEQGIANIPNLALALFSYPAMVASISGSIAQERANNRAIALVEQGMSPEAAAAQARTTAGDLAIAIGVAVPEVLLERAGARALGFLDGDTFAPGVLAGAGRGLLTEAGTEALQEASQTVAEQVGTRDTGVLGVDPASVGKRALGGALAGGALGGAVGGVRGYRASRAADDPVAGMPTLRQAQDIAPDPLPQQVETPPTVEEQPVVAPTPARPVEPRLPPVEQTTALVDESAAVEEGVPAPAPSRRQTRERAEGAVEAGTRTELYEIEPQVQEGPVRQPVPRRQRRSPVEGDVDTADATDGELIVQDLIEPETRDEKADDGSYTNLMEDSNPEIPNPDAELDAKSLKEELNKELAEQKRRVDKAVSDVADVELDPARVTRQLDEMGEAVKRLGQDSDQVDLRPEAEIESEKAIIEAIQQLNKEGVSTAEVVQKILAVHASELGRSGVVPTTDTERFALQEQYSGPVFEGVLRDLGKTDEEIAAMTTTERIGFSQAMSQAQSQELLPVPLQDGVDIDGDRGVRQSDKLNAVVASVIASDYRPSYVEIMAILNTIPRIDARRKALVQEAGRLDSKRNKDNELSDEDQLRFIQIGKEHNAILTSLASLLTAARAGKSSAARIMRATQFVVNSHGDLASAMSEATLRNGGPLSPKQKEKLTTLWNKHKKLYDQGKSDLEQLKKEYERRREELNKAQDKIGERIDDAKEINQLITEINKGLEGVKRTARKVQSSKKRKEKRKQAEAQGKKKPTKKKEKDEDSSVSELTRQQKRLERLIDRLNTKIRKEDKKKEDKKPTAKKTKRPSRRTQRARARRRKLPLTPEQAALREAVELERKANRATTEAKKRTQRAKQNERRNLAKRKQLESSTKKSRDAVTKKRGEVRRAKRRMSESIDAALMGSIRRGFRTFYGASLVINASTDLSMFGRQGALLLADDLGKASRAAKKSWRARNRAYAEEQARERISDPRQTFKSQGGLFDPVIEGVSATNAQSGQIENVEEVFAWASNIDDLRDFGGAFEGFANVAEALITPSTNIHATFLAELRDEHFNAFLDIIAESRGIESIEQIERRTGKKATAKQRQKFVSDLQAEVDSGNLDPVNFKIISNLLNLMTGRSLVDVGFKGGNEVGNFVKSLMFSPQYTFSRFELPIVAASTAYNSVKRSVVPTVSKAIRSAPITGDLKNRLIENMRRFDESMSAARSETKLGRYSVAKADDAVIKELNRRFLRLYKLGGSILIANVTSALAYALLSGEDLDEAVDLAEERIVDYVNPASPQFGMLRIDNPADPGETIKMDMFGGMPSTTRRLAIFNVEEGEFMPFSKGEGGPFEQTIGGNLIRLAVNKRHPLISAGILTYDGYDFFGDPVTAPQWLEQVIEIGIGPELAPEFADITARVIAGGASAYSPISIRSAVMTAHDVADGQEDPLSADFYAETFIPILFGALGFTTSTYRDTRDYRFNEFLRQAEP